jgi:hypothetical protein
MQKARMCLASAAGLNIAAIFFWAVAFLLLFLVPAFDERDTDSVLPLTSSPIDERNLTDEKITEIINADQSIPRPPQDDTIKNLLFCNPTAPPTHSNSKNAAQSGSMPTQSTVQLQTNLPAVDLSSNPKSYAETSI